MYIYSISQLLSIFRALDKLNITVSVTLLLSPSSIPSFPVFSVNKIPFIRGKILFGFTVYSGDRNYLINAAFFLKNPGFTADSYITNKLRYVYTSIYDSLPLRFRPWILVTLRELQV
jgi:hypothetical protein